MSQKVITTTITLKGASTKDVFEVQALVSKLKNLVNSLNKPNITETRIICKISKPFKQTLS